MFFNQSINYTKLWALASVVLFAFFYSRGAVSQVADEYWPITNGAGLIDQAIEDKADAFLTSEVTVIEAERISGIRGVFLNAEGNAEVLRDTQSVKADYLHYDLAEDQISGRQNVELTKPGILIFGDTLTYQLKPKTGEIGEARYFIGERGHGDAEKLIFLGPDRQRALNATYTSCDVSKEDVYIKAGRLDIYQDEDVGSARHATVWFKGAPILYSPYISFPLSDERKTGFLTPSYGQSVQNGFEVFVPFYLNIAPSMDGIVTARSMSERGLLMKSDWRYLGQTYKGDLTYDYLQLDKVIQKQTGFNQSRSFYRLDHQQYFGTKVSSRISLQGISDDFYLKDLEANKSRTSVIHLPRSMSVAINDDNWAVSSRVVHYQTLGFSRRPFQLDPRIEAHYTPALGLGFESESMVQYTDYDRINPLGVKDGAERLVIYPAVRYTSDNEFYSFSPKIGIHHTMYDLENGVTEESSVPIYSARMSVAFERDTKILGNSLVQTLEPTIYYVHVPFRDQDHLPVFDSKVTDFRFSSAFSENIFSGHDRINDADSLTFGLVSKFLNSDNGAERFGVSLAQRFNLDEEFVVVSTGDEPRTANRSDILMQAGGRISRNWGMSSTMQYSGALDEVVQQRHSLHYRPGGGRAVNFMQQFVRDKHEQFDISGQWPIRGRWGLAGRWNYSNDAKKLLEGVFGLEYKAGCWAFRAVANRLLTGREAGKDLYTTSYFIQLELTGITRIGSDALGTLSESIPGYSMY